MMPKSSKFHSTSQNNSSSLFTKFPNNHQLYENIYGDLYMIEENKNSYLKSKISDELPQKYFSILSEHFTEIINSDKSPSKSMIDFLRNISSPLTNLINNKEEYISKDEVDFSENETLSAGKYLSRMKLI